jgi:hypothetical protein
VLRSSERVELGPLLRDESGQGPLYPWAESEGEAAPVSVEIICRREVASAFAKPLDLGYRTDVLASRRGALSASNSPGFLDDQLKIFGATSRLQVERIEQQDVDVSGVFAEGPEGSGPVKIWMLEVGVARV